MMKRIAILLLICLSNGWLFANHWTPNHSSYEDNMTLTGVIQINGVEQQSTTLEVGVFCGEECRGSGYPTYFLPTQRYVVQLLIFGEPGDQLTFKLFDSDSGQELDLASPDAVTFVANGYGTLFVPYVLNFTGNGTHWIPTESSYEDNMTLTGVIQINGVEQQSTSLEVGVFCGTECRGTGLTTYFLPSQRYVVQLLIFGEQGDQLTFKLYDHTLGQELDLTSPNAVTFTTNGYGTLLNPYVLNFTGSVPESYTISASANPEEGGTIEGVGNYLGEQMCTLTATANEGYAFTNWTEGGTVVSTTPIYAFSVTSSRTLIANFTNTGGNHWVPNQSSYEDNMTLTGVIQINGVEQQSTTLEVGVFCGEECRGTGMPTFFFPTQRYVVQLLIFGESGDQFTFKLYDHALGQELNLTSPEAVTFTANGYGSLSRPYVLNFTGFHFITPGTWSTPANWLGGALPTATDEVFIDAPCQLDQNASVAALAVSGGQSLLLQSGKILTVTGNLTNTVATGLVIEDGAQLVHNVANVQATVKKVISPFSGSGDGWHLIALPLTGSSNVASVDNLLENQYDLYAYDEATTYWRNQKNTESGFTALEATKGYLYANSAEVTLEFSGTLENGSATITVPLSYTDGAHLSGFNLIGNPFPCNAYLNREYYILTTDGTDINPEPIPATTPIPPCTAVFVKAIAEGDTVVFTRVAP